VAHKKQAEECVLPLLSGQGSQEAESMKIELGGDELVVFFLWTLAMSLIIGSLVVVVVGAPTV